MLEVQIKALFCLLIFKGKLPLSAMWQVRYTETVPYYKTKYLFKIIDSQESKKNSQETK